MCHPSVVFLAIMSAAEFEPESIRHIVELDLITDVDSLSRQLVLMQYDM